jgi:hypothetical protein
VFNKLIVTGALVAAASSGALVAAQAPTQAPQTPAQGAQAPRTPAQGAAATEQKSAATTLIGCVYRERDVPGRAPNVAERVGILEDYIFAEVPSSPVAANQPSTGTGGAVGTSGTAAAMYKIEFVDDDKLKDLVGKRVEVVGRIDAEAGDSAKPAAGTATTTTDKVIGRDRVDLAELEVSSIKEVAGTCPASPSGN